MTQMTIRVPRRAVTLIAASGLALSGAAALATGWSASATQGDPHKVWVCKYVQKPGSNEVLKGGKNPIYVDWASLTDKPTAPYVGATFSDGQLKSVVVQVGGSDPGVSACGAVVPPTTTSTMPPTTTSTMPPTTTSTAPPTTTTTAPPTTTTTVPSTTTSTTPGGGGGGGTGTPTTTTATVPSTTTSTTPGGGGGNGGGGGAGGGQGAGGGMGGGVGGVTGVTPGVAAPHTGGEGDSTSDNRLLGSGLLAGGLALAAGEAVRRRRETATR